MVDGLRNLDDGYIPPIFLDNDGSDLLDRKTMVGTRESIEWTRRLTDVGVFGGISSGAVMAGAADVDWQAAAVTIAAVTLMLSTRLNPLWMLLAGGTLGGLGLL